MANTFRYFSFGSNLLRQRIQLRNPSAKFLTIAKLDNYRLGFDYSDFDYWHGCVATVHDCPGKYVWGCLWEVHNDHMPTLDEQEGVSDGVYRPLEVQVTTKDGEMVPCRTYQLLILDAEDKRPSPHYKDVIIKGAKQNGLPQDYIEQLEQIEDNGYNGTVELYEDVMALIDKK